MRRTQPVCRRRVFTRQHFGQSEERGVIGHKAGGEDQGGVLLVQLGQLLLQNHVVVTGARYVPGASCSCAMLLQGITVVGQGEMKKLSSTPTP